jgi:ornithine carbamoyltransferase
MARSFLTMEDLSKEDLGTIFEKAKLRKAQIKERKTIEALKNQVVGLLFEKPSTRTRNSFEAAVWRLGGSAIYMPSNELQLKRGEPIKDTARILGDYMDCLVARVYAHQTVAELAEFAGVPVINALSDLTHPTQVVCDFFTIKEVFGKFEGLTLTYIGDGNNMCNSLFLISAMTGMNMNAACPKGYYPDDGLFNDAKKIAAQTGAKLQIIEDPKAASEGVDILYTDVWVSMGEDAEKEKRLKDLAAYQINAEIVAVAAKDVKVMHCLPAHRGLEITDDVIEGPQSIVWQQGENKMHGAAGIMDFLLG